MIIYLITNKINGKQYVGQTIHSMEDRWREHNWASSNGCRVLKNAINKYGKDNFTIEEVDKASSLEELNKKEMEFISKFNTLSPLGYNLKTGGNRSKYSQETRQIMSQRKTDGTFVPWNKGLTKETDRRVGAQGSRGDKNPRKGKPGYWKGKKIPLESVEKMRKTKTGVPFNKTEAYIVAIREVARKRQIKILCHQNNTVYDSIDMAAKDLNIHQSNVSRVVGGKLKHIKGYTFKKV